MNPDTILSQVRRGYSGQGGPLMPLTFSTRGEDPTEDVLRANRILNQMDRLNLYRIAAEKAPFAMPIKGTFRFTSRPRSCASNAPREASSSTHGGGGQKAMELPMGRVISPWAMTRS